MKRPYHLQWEAKKNRLKRRSGDILWEVGRVFLLTGAIVSITVTLLIGFDLALRSPRLHVRETAVRGCQELTEKEILDLAAVRSSANLLTINRDAVARRIRNNPWVREVFVGREFPDRLVIVVQERKAVALLQKENGLHLIDEAGTPFKKLKADEESDLPVLTGCVRGEKVDEVLVKTSLALLGDLEEFWKGPAIGKVSEIHGNETFGLSLFTDTGLCLQLGFDGYHDKLQRLTSVMADLDEKNLRTGFMLIDLSNPAKVSVQRRNVFEPVRPGKTAVAGRGFRM